MHERESFEFPTGVTLLEVQSPRSTIPHRLVCARLADSTAGGGVDADATAYWIDARNAAVTHALYDCAASPRHLEPLRIARAFTAYQHHSLVRAVARRAGPETELIVAPNVASLYRDAELADWEREDLLAAALETLSELGRVLDCPVLVTSADEDRAATVSEHAAATIDCVRTREGIRFERSDRSADDGTDDLGSGIGTDATAGYWHGAYWQTTIPYWVDLYGSVDEVRSVVDAHDRGLLEVTA